MNKTIYGIRSVAKFFRVTRTTIKDLIADSKINPKLKKVGYQTAYAFTPEILATIKKLRSKKKAAHKRREAKKKAARSGRAAYPQITQIGDPND